MRKMIIIGGAFLFALVPAGLGLAANPSLSARVPIPPAQVHSVREAATPSGTPTTSPASSPSGGPDSAASPTSRPSASDDDHGGDRHRGGPARGRHSGHDG
jgi:hypothetical protein